MRKIQNLQEALNSFEKATIQHGEATEKGDYRTANKNYAAIAKVIMFLREQDEVDSLSRFLSHSSDLVKVWAATYLLPIEEHEAIQALEEVARGRGISSLDAEITLSEWRKGNLKLS